MWRFTGQDRPDFAIAPGQGQESVWDYPRPPICVRDNRTVVVKSGDIIIARTTSVIRVLETASPPTYYIPPDDIDFTYLQRTPGSSFCEWKGGATYWSVVAPTIVEKSVGWSYESPTPRFAEIRGFLSFYPGRLECYVDDQRVAAQPGGFYGGWITDEVVGPFKGSPGTSHW